jgi:tungstate transport system ATP-binding protein
LSASALRLIEPEAAPAPAASPPLPLELDRVCFEAGGCRLIDDISLSIGSGVRTVLLGPNGAGKSLLLRLCHGLIRPTSGTIRWAERDAAALRRSQTFVFQRPVLLRRSAAANIAYALAVNGVPRREREGRVAAALEEVGLTRLAERPARVLSGGEQQRLALARAWALEPCVLFLDEPTANLDPAASRTIEAVISDMHRRGVKVIMTTHDLGQAKRHADEVVFLHKGRLVEHTPAHVFFHQPRSREGRAFLAGELLW